MDCWEKAQNFLKPYRVHTRVKTALWQLEVFSELHIALVKPEWVSALYGAGELSVREATKFIAEIRAKRDREGLSNEPTPCINCGEDYSTHVESKTGRCLAGRTHPGWRSYYAPSYSLVDPMILLGKIRAVASLATCGQSSRNDPWLIDYYGLPPFEALYAILELVTEGRTP